MQFTLSFTLATLIIIVNLVIPSAAFVMDTFRNHDCSDYVEKVYVLDDTHCERNLKGFSSYMITEYGGAKQMGHFFADSVCSAPATIDIIPVDGSIFKIGECVDVGQGKVAHSASSDLSKTP